MLFSPLLDAFEQVFRQQWKQRHNLWLLVWIELDKIRKVEREDVLVCCTSYLDLRRLVVVVLVPSSSPFLYDNIILEEEF